MHYIRLLIKCCIFFRDAKYNHTLFYATMYYLWIVWNSLVICMIIFWEKYVKLSAFEGSTLFSNQWILNRNLLFNSIVFLRLLFKPRIFSLVIYNVIHIQRLEVLIRLDCVDFYQNWRVEQLKITIHSVFLTTGEMSWMRNAWRTSKY